MEYILDIIMSIQGIVKQRQTFRLERQLSSLKKNVALGEDPGSVPRTHMIAHDHLYLQFQEMQHRLPASTDTRHACLYTYMQTKHHTHKMSL